MKLLKFHGRANNIDKILVHICCYIKYSSFRFIRYRVLATQKSMSSKKCATGKFKDKV